MRKRYVLTKNDDGKPEMVEATEAAERERAKGVRCQSYEFKVWSQEPWCPGFKHYDTDGQPLVTSKKQINEAVARGHLMYERD